MWEIPITDCFSGCSKLKLEHMFQVSTSKYIALPIVSMEAEMMTDSITVVTNIVSIIAGHKINDLIT